MDNEYNPNLRNLKLNEQNVQHELSIIRPYMEKDGGYLEFVDIKDSYVYIEFEGTCSSCGQTDETMMLDAIERSLMIDFPMIKGVKRVL